MKPVFLDANIIMYALGKDHPLKTPCRRHIEKIKEGVIKVVTSAEMLQEILHRYYGIRMPEVAEAALSAVKIFCVEIYPIRLSEIERAQAILEEYPAINARDAIHAATMFNYGIERILSADPHFDMIHGIRRIKPLDS